MRNILFFIILSIPSLVFCQDSKFSLKTSTGLSYANKEYVGFATSVSLCYDIFKYAGVELMNNNMYQYNDGKASFSESYTNTSIGLGLITKPLSIANNNLILRVGISKSFLNRTKALKENPEDARASATSGRFNIFSPYYGVSYAYSFNRFSIGLEYERQFFKLYSQNIYNNQISFIIITRL